MQKKKEPLRMCSACREMKSKKELLRIVKSKEGEVSLDITGKKNGRGAYLCRQEACLKKAMKIRALERMLEAEIPKDLYDSLLEKMKSE